MENSISNIIKNGFGDAQITGLGWTETGEDFWIQLNLSNNKKLKLLFVWVTNLLIDLDFKEYFGMPLVFDTSFEHVENKFWEISIILGAAPEGEIKFECNDIQLLKNSMCYKADNWDTHDFMRCYMKCPKKCSLKWSE